VLGDEVVRRLGLRPGTRLLDVAAGSGGLSIPAARVGAGVVATDLAPAMIERLNARARAEGLSTLLARTMDGHALDLDDDAFDVAVSVNGVSLFPDMARGLAELVRVTRPGGRVVIVAFGPIEKVEFIVFFARAVQAAVPDVTPLPTNPPPLPFQAADPDVLHERLANAGLREVRIDTITWEMAFDSVQHLWKCVHRQQPHRRPDGRPAQQRAAGRRHTRPRRDASRAIRGCPGAVLRAEVNVGIGTV
jgi:SAM-dependent methyltransferase